MSDTERTEELEAQIARLTEQIDDLSERLDSVTQELRRHHPADELPEEVALAISAAVAAYLGKRAKVKRVRVRRGTGWAAQARSDIHRSHAAFGSR
ncbi:hypothetical protein [Mobilicoccus caccae]|uniref:Methylmalonyl-CoA carboxyltransferase 12S subunit n=1 Tax=Mobilicoccus caccae TaxID=1859295 RepID=A0ABQ6IP92_9MICO|nr:hypothetical protein [Mobilicoccus caccae]GMA39017.1 hypothetical protein GCM10025883_10620 [Mobilicoccus caccae]